ncbi:hypothetical protein ACWCYY_33585 [Kitasatospora sp. NPDC001664]
MRTSVINRFAKLAPLSVATLLLTSGITLITADTAWACGPSPAEPIYEGPRRATEPQQSFIPELPRTITAGGAKVEVGIELFNGTGSAYRQIAPGFGLLAPKPTGGKQGLRAQDVTVEVMVSGAWKTLPTRYDCGAFYTDTAVLKGSLEDGRAKRFMFRVGLKSTTPAAQDSILLYTTEAPATLKVLHPAPAAKPASPKPTPSATKAAALAAAPAEAPKATPSAPATATPTTAATPAELASTGPKAPAAALVGSAAALLAVGTAALLFARRRTAR